MQIYVVINEDRHIDTSVLCFSTAQAAVAYAQKCVKDLDGQDEELTLDMKRAGWLYLGKYSCEGDGYRVVEAVLDYYR